MEYRKIKKSLGNISNQPFKFSTRNGSEINDKSREMNSINSQIKFRNSVIRSSLCDYNDSYIHVKGTIVIPTQQPQVHAQTMLIRKWYLQIVLPLLIP